MNWEKLITMLWDTMPMWETFVAGILLSGFMSLLTWIWPAGDNKNRASTYRVVAVGMGVLFTLLLMEYESMMSGGMPEIRAGAINFFFMFFFSELFYRKIGVKFLKKIWK